MMEEPVTFKDRFLKKISIDKLARQVMATIGPVGGEQRIDKTAMKRLLEMSPYRYRKERDLDLWIRERTDGPDDVLVLDNDLPVYKTPVEDVAMRKSPTVKEMISIRNAIKILSDADVIKSKKADTLKAVWRSCIDELDLSFSPADLDDLALEARACHDGGDAECLEELFDIFAELLGLEAAPKGFRVKGFTILGVRRDGKAGEIRFGPALLHDPVENTLKWIDAPVSNLDKEQLLTFQKIAAGKAEAPAEGEAAIRRLRGMASGIDYDPYAGM